MSTKRRLVALFDRRSVRRIVLVPATVIFAILGVALSPLILAGAAIGDLAARRAHYPRLRLAGLAIGALVVETLTLLISLFIWIVTGFGFLGTERWRWHMHRGYMGVYTKTLLWLVTRALGTTVEWRDHADLSDGPVIVAARHTSFFDALIPSTLLSNRNQLLAHHVVTHGLRYSPCIDIVGHRFPNRFIKRNPGEGSRELVHIRDLGTRLDDRSAAVIFPEGTFRNPERFERVVRRIGRRNPELAARAQQLDHVLPPQANGIYALLEGAPAADIVVCVNTGFEPFGSIQAIVNRPVATTTIRIETWRIARSEVPDEPAAFNEWLFEQFVVVDAWVARHRGR